MVKMAVMAISSKNLKKIFFSRTRRAMILNLGMKHQRDELYKVYINYDLEMTLADFMTRPTQVAHAFEWGK